MDSLMSDSGAGTLINYFIADRLKGSADASNKYGMTPVSFAATELVAGTGNLTPGKGASICTSLRKAGITKTKTMASATDFTTIPAVGSIANFNPTFNYYTGVATDFDFGTVGDCTGYVVELTNTAKIAAATGLSKEDVDNKVALVSAGGKGHTFVAFGVGTASEMMGRTIQDAPVHFASNGEVGPTNAYNRLLAIFEVDASTTKATMAVDRAKFAGTGMAMHDLLGVQSSLASYHKSMTE
jgi:hypothetical protein